MSALFDKVNTFIQSHIPAGSHVQFSGFLKPKTGAIALGLELDFTLPPVIEPIAEEVLGVLQVMENPPSVTPTAS
jgi:hypothetical protein